MLHNWSADLVGVYCKRCGERRETTANLDGECVHRPTPKPATVEPPMWAPVKMVTLEKLKEQYPEPPTKCAACGLAAPTYHKCPSPVLLDAWRRAPNGSRLFEHAPGAYSLHTPIKPVEVPTTEPPEWKNSKGKRHWGLSMFERYNMADGDRFTGKDSGRERIVHLGWLTDFDDEMAALYGWELVPKEVGHSPQKWEYVKERRTLVPIPEPSPLDRALSDFIARRKAKREAAAYALDDELCGYESWDTFDAAHEVARVREATQDALSRAMSLPFDPTIQERVAPYRLVEK